MAFCQRCGGGTAEQMVEGRIRPVCDQCGFVVFLDPKLAVAVVIERNGAILLGKRGEHTREPGRWSFPAGFVDRGEAVEDAAVREVLEETGLKIAVGALLGLFSRPGETVVLAAYAAESVSGEPVAGDDLDQLAWFEPGDPPDLAFPHDRAIIAAWQAWRDRDQAETRPRVKS